MSDQTHDRDTAPTHDAGAVAGEPGPPTDTEHELGSGPPHDPAQAPVAVGGDPSGGATATDGPAGATDQADEDLDPELRAAQDPRTPGQLLVALEEAAQERDEYLDGLRRSRAEFDNYRRRTTREAATARRAGVGDLATSLLEVLDDLDRTAEVAASSADAGLAAGIAALHRKLVEALLAAGIERIDATDVPFDATRHEAVQQVPAEEPVDEPEVAQVLRPGYVHGDRCLRAAMVVVRQ